MSNSILISIYESISTMPEYPCYISSFPQDYMNVGVGMIYTKNWPFTRLFNHHFMKVGDAAMH